MSPAIEPAENLVKNTDIPGVYIILLLGAYLVCCSGMLKIILLNLVP
jgi:hypothetical protein